jgi:hypothetical protein
MLLWLAAKFSFEWRDQLSASAIQRTRFVRRRSDAGGSKVPGLI